MHVALVALALGMTASARPSIRRDATALKNGQAAIALNAQYETLTATSSCTTGEDACVTGKFAQCVNGKFVLQSCATGTICAAIPVDSPQTGTLTTCTTQSDLDSRLAASGANSSSGTSSSGSVASSSTSTTSASIASSSSATSDNAGSGAATASNSTASTDNTSSGATAGATASNSTASTDNAGSGAAAGATASNSTASTDNSGSGVAAAATASNSTATTGNNNTGTATQAAIGALSSTDITQNATEDSPDAQSSLTLDPRVIATGFMNNGQDVQEAGQVASLTSNNNFINYCLTQGNLPITNGKQIQTGSCNPAPIGTIPAVGNMPSAKFANPANGASIPADQAFTITMNINNLDTGNFVNANENYFAAPQQLNAQGLIVGHTHVVIEALDSVNQTTLTNPQEFAFFKGVNTAAQNGAVTADVTNGVPAGSYRLCSINSSSNHQPVIVPIAQHGALDDCVYFTATGGTPESPSVANEAGPAAESAAAAAAAASATAAK